MVLQFIIQKLKSLLLIIVGIFRRALCCFKRKRCNSEDSIPLTAIGVVPNSSTTGYNEVDNWNNWEDNQTKTDKPNSIQEHIELYRQQTLLARQKSKEDNNEDNLEHLFEDMAPRITRQTKIFLNNDEKSDSNTSRLSLNPQGIIASGGELGEWEEGTGWEEQTQSDLNPQDIIREKRRQERERRLWEQQQKKHEKHNRPLGAKIS